MKEAPKGIEPKRNENEARKEAEGEGPDKMTHVQGHFHVQRYTENIVMKECKDQKKD